MAKFGKFIGGGLGFVMGGPIGAIIGFAVGSIFDSAEISTSSSVRTTSGDFAMSLLVLIAAMLKADGKVLKSELDYVKVFLRQNFGEQGAQEALIMLKNLLNQQISVNDVCNQIANNVNYSSRLQLLHFLYGLGYADGQLEKSEENLLNIIAGGLRIQLNDRESIKSMFRNTIEDYYKILEVEPTASDEEIKKAYRRMAMKYHPDKVVGMGDDVRKAAQEKFQTLSNAYEKIKKERGMS